MMTIVDKVKLVVVYRDSPDIETEIGTYPSKDAAMPAFQNAIAKDDTLRAKIEPVQAEATQENSASYRWRPGTEHDDRASAGTIMGRAPRVLGADHPQTTGSPEAETDRKHAKEDLSERHTVRR
jgi:hypothetical protein